MKINDYKTEELVEKLNEGLALGKSGVVICKELGLARSSVLTRIKRDGYIHDKNTNQYLKEGAKEIEPSKKVLKEKVKKTTSKDIKEKTKKVEKKDIKPKTKNSIVEEIKPAEQNVVEEAYEGEWKVEEAIAKLRKELANKKGNQDKKQTEKLKEETNIKEDEELKIEENKIIEDKLEDKKSGIKENLKNKNEEIEKSRMSGEEKESSVAKKEIDELRLMIQEMNERLKVVEKKKDVEKNISIKNTKETTTRSIRLYKEVNDKLNKYLKKNKEKKVIDIISLAILEYMEK